MNYNYACFQSKSQRAKRDSIRIGISVDFTLAYVDFLLKDEKFDPIYRPMSPVGQPKLPLFIRAAGTGSYFDPWHIDTNDRVVQAVSQSSLLDRFIDAQWLNFIAELNKRLRAVSKLDLYRGLKRVMKFLSNSATLHPLGGILVELATFVNKDPNLKDKMMVFENPLAKAANQDVVDAATKQRSVSASDTPSSEVESLFAPLFIMGLHEVLCLEDFRTKETPTEFQAVCKGIRSGALTLAIVIYHKFAIDSTGTWTPHYEDFSEKTDEVTRPTIDGTTTNVLHVTELKVGPDGRKIEYGSKATEMAKFYKMTMSPQDREEPQQQGKEAELRQQETKDELPKEASHSIREAESPVVGQPAEDIGDSGRESDVPKEASTESTSDNSTKAPDDPRLSFFPFIAGENDRISILPSIIGGNWTSKIRPNNRRRAGDQTPVDTNLKNASVRKSFNQSEISYEITSKSMWRWNEHFGVIVNTSDSIKGIPPKTLGIVARMFVTEDWKEMISIYCLQIAKALRDDLWVLLHMVLIGRNMVPAGPYFLKQVIEIMLELCCVLDLIFAALISATLFCSWDDYNHCHSVSYFAIIISVYPLALVVAPILGYLTVVVQARGHMPRIYSIWTRLGNISYAILLGIYFTSHEYMPKFVGSMVFAMGINKATQNCLIDLYIAHLENYRSNKSWDGLSTSIVAAKENDDLFIYY